MASCSESGMLTYRRESEIQQFDDSFLIKLARQTQRTIRANETFDDDTLATWQKIVVAISDLFKPITDSYVLTDPTVGRTIQRLYEVPSFYEFIASEDSPAVDFCTALYAQMGCPATENRGLTLTIGSDYSDLGNLSLDEFKTILEETQKDLDISNKKKIDPERLEHWKNITSSCSKKLSFVDTYSGITTRLFTDTLIALIGREDFKAYVNTDAPSLSYLIRSSLGFIINEKASGVRTDDEEDFDVDMKDYDGQRLGLQTPPPSPHSLDKTRSADYIPGTSSDGHTLKRIPLSLDDAIPKSSNHSTDDTENSVGDSDPVTLQNTLANQFLSHEIISDEEASRNQSVLRSQPEAHAVAGSTQHSQLSSPRSSPENNHQSPPPEATFPTEETQLLTERRSQSSSPNNNQNSTRPPFQPMLPHGGGGSGLPCCQVL